MDDHAPRHPRVSLVIPTLDEEPVVRANLAAAVALADEVVVCDGGSRDGTVKAARSAGARVVTSAAGRGLQLNRGVEATRLGDALIFLHADTRLPELGVAAVRDALRGGAVGGGFVVRFDGQRPIYRVGEAIVNWRSRVFRTPLGDQAQFVSRRAFEDLGGFAEWPILEDLDFIRRLKRHGRIAVLEPAVVTSARRFERRGITRTLAGNWLIFALYFLGVPVARLERLYRQVR